MVGRAGKQADSLEHSLIERIREDASGTPDTGVAAATLVSELGAKLSVPAVEVRRAIWRLVDSEKIEFTKGRRLRLGSDHRAA